MNQTKRQGNFDKSRVIKKKNCIENLSNELFYEIFDYLDGYHIYIAFSNLNIHFENLFISSSFFMKTEISTIKIFDIRYKRFIKSNKHHIISLNFECQTSFHDFINLYTIDSLFIRLESLSLEEISSIKLLTLLFYLRSLPRLSSLSIRIIDDDQDMGHIYQMIFNLSLKYFRVSVPIYPQLDIILPISAQDQFSSIEYLIIYHSCTLNQLTDIISYTPQLSYLDCFNIIDLEENLKLDIMIKLNNLIHLSITIVNIDFDEFEEFLIKLCSKLQFFNVIIRSFDENYLNTDRWEQLIIENIPYLEKFRFNYTDDIDDEFSINNYHLSIDYFTSSFWIDRKWIFKLLIGRNEITYSIRPYIENWIDHQEYLSVHQDSNNNIIYSSDCYVLPIEISIDDTFSTKTAKFLINKLNPIFNIMEITHLNIDCRKISASILILILKTLQNLRSIKISKSPLCEPMNLNDRDSTSLNKFLKINKITKFTLENINKLEEIDFIFHNFPRIQFFGFDRVRNFNLKPIVEYMLREIKDNNISHPMVICVFTVNAKCDRVEKLYKMIDSKK